MSRNKTLGTKCAGLLNSRWLANVMQGEWMNTFDFNLHTIQDVILKVIVCRNMIWPCSSRTTMVKTPGPDLLAAESVPISILILRKKQDVLGDSIPRVTSYQQPSITGWSFELLDWIKGEWSALDHAGCLDPFAERETQLDRWWACSIDWEFIKQRRHKSCPTCLVTKKREKTMIKKMNWIILCMTWRITVRQ